MATTGINGTQVKVGTLGRDRIDAGFDAELDGMAAIDVTLQAEIDALDLQGDATDVTVASLTARMDTLEIDVNAALSVINGV